jgi:hypothetical protein
VPTTNDIFGTNIEPRNETRIDTHEESVRFYQRIDTHEESEVLPTSFLIGKTLQTFLADEAY